MTILIQKLSNESWKYFLWNDTKLFKGWKAIINVRMTAKKGSLQVCIYSGRQSQGVIRANRSIFNQKYIEYCLILWASVLHKTLLLIAKNLYKMKHPNCECSVVKGKLAERWFFNCRKQLFGKSRYCSEGHSISL